MNRLQRAAGILTIVAAVAVIAAGVRVGAAEDDGSTSGSLVSGGVTRTFRLYVPRSAPLGASLPLVVVLHGGYGSGLQAERAYHWDAAAESGGFLVAYPDGLERAWNAGTCCGSPMRDRVDDVAFLTQLVRTFVRDDRADPRRVYFTGMSNGALMSYRMACEAPIPIAAIGPVAGTLVSSCTHPQPTSILAIHGLDDRNVPFAGGRGGGQVGQVQPVLSSLAVWTTLDHCGSPSHTAVGPVRTDRWSCAEGRAVTLIAIEGAGHQWPGGAPPSGFGAAAASLMGLHLDQPSTAFDATGTLWAFFAHHVALKSS